MTRREAQKAQVLNQLAVFDRAWKMAHELGIEIIPMLQEHADAADSADFKVTLESVLVSVFWRLTERVLLKKEGQALTDTEG